MQIQAQLKPHGSMEVALSINLSYNEVCDILKDLAAIKGNFSTSAATYNLFSLLKNITSNVTATATAQTDHDSN